MSGAEEGTPGATPLSPHQVIQFSLGKAVGRGSQPMRLSPSLPTHECFSPRGLTFVPLSSPASEPLTEVGGVCLQIG